MISKCCFYKMNIMTDEKLLEQVDNKNNISLNKEKVNFYY